MTQSKISKYLGSPEFIEAARRHVRQAIAETEALGLDAGYDKPTLNRPDVPEELREWERAPAVGREVI